jgi:hypothetical protein
MEVTKASKRIVAVEIIGMSSIIALLWLDDVVDLSALSGISYKTMMLWQTIVTTILCVLVLFWLTSKTRLILKRLKRLEGLLPVCSFCKKIRVNEEWVAIERYVAEHSDAVFSHGFCPECGEQHYGKYYKKN